MENNTVTIIMSITVGTVFIAIIVAAIIWSLHRKKPIEPEKKNVEMDDDDEDRKARIEYSKGMKEDLEGLRKSLDEYLKTMNNGLTEVCETMNNGYDRIEFLLRNRPVESLDENKNVIDNCN